MRLPKRLCRQIVNEAKDVGGRSEASYQYHDEAELREDVGIAAGGHLSLGRRLGGSWADRGGGDGDDLQGEDEEGGRPHGSWVAHALDHARIMVGKTPTDEPATMTPMAAPRFLANQVEIQATASHGAYMNQTPRKKSSGWNKNEDR